MWDGKWTLPPGTSAPLSCCPLCSWNSRPFLGPGTKLNLELDDEYGEFSDRGRTCLNNLGGDSWCKLCRSPKYLCTQVMLVCFKLPKLQQWTIQPDTQKPLKVTRLTWTAVKPKRSPLRACLKSLAKLSSSACNLLAKVSSSYCSQTRTLRTREENLDFAC